MPSCDVKEMFTRARLTNRRLYHWMTVHHDGLVDELGPGRIEWAPVMYVVKELGLVDKSGKPPTQDTLYRTWKRVRCDIAARSRRPLQREPKLSHDEIAPGVKDLEQQRMTHHVPVELHGPSALSRPLLDIKPARSLDQLPSSSGGASASAIPQLKNSASGSEENQRGDSADQLKRVLDAIGANRTPLPKAMA